MHPSLLSYVDAIRSAHPSWLFWSELFLWPVVAFVAGWLATGPVIRRVLSQAGDPATTHWAERARYHIVGLTLYGAMILPMTIYSGLEDLTVDITHGPRPLLPVIAAVALFGGALSGLRYGGSRGASRYWQRFSRGLVSALVITTAIVGPILPVFFFRDRLGLAAYLLPLFWIGSLVLRVPARVLLATGLAHAAPAALQDHARELASSLGVPAPSVIQVDVGITSVVLQPLGRDVVVSRCEALDEDERKALVSREVAALTAPRWWRVANAAVIGHVAFYPYAILVPEHWGIPLVLGLVLIVIALLLLTGIERRHLEPRIDALARLHEPSPGAFARALERTFELNLAPLVGFGRGRSPWDRLIAAGLEPDYPRPAPPPKRVLLVSLLASLTILTTVHVAVFNPTRPALHALGFSETTIARVNIATGTALPRELFGLGLDAIERDDLELAEAYLIIAHVERPEAGYLLPLAHAVAADGQCCFTLDLYRVYRETVSPWVTHDPSGDLTEHAGSPPGERVQPRFVGECHAACDE